jgi:hypothetical protein
MLKESTMQNQTPTRIVFATDIFLREMKRQWQRLHPSANPVECPVQILDAYPHAQQIAMFRAVEKSIEASSGMNETYENWLKLKTGQTASA